jgi:hypothetical protein
VGFTSSVTTRPPLASDYYGAFGWHRRRDITLKSNPPHILSPNNWKMVNQGRKAKPGSDAWKEYVRWYKGLLWERYKADPQPFLDLLESDYVVLCCC